MKRKSVVIILVIAIISGCFVSALSAAFAADNLCSDGSFEGYTDGMAIGDSKDSYFKFYGTNRNTGVYSSEAAYGSGSQLGAKIVRGANGNAQLNCQLSSFDKNKTYQIDFDSKVIGQAWSGRFTMLGLPYYGWILSGGDDGGEIYLAANEWTHNSFTVGPEDADYLFTSESTEKGVVIRIFLATDGTLYLDNFSIKEKTNEPTPTPTPTAAPTPTPSAEPTDGNMIIDGSFESYTNGDAVSSEQPSGYCSFYGTGSNTAVYTTAASHGINGTIGVMLQRGKEGSAEINCQLVALDKTKTYILEFDSKVDGSAWAGRFSMLGFPGYGWLLDCGELQLSTQWQHYALVLGPDDGDYDFTAENTAGGAIVRFYLADEGTLYLDNISLKEGNVIPTPTPTVAPSPEPEVQHGNAPVSSFKGTVRENRRNGKISVGKSEQGYVPQTDFSDLTQTEWARESVMLLFEQGIVSGRDETHFAPNDLVLREEFVKLLVCALDIEKKEANKRFSDVEQGKWYYDYILTATANGLVSGMDADTFGVGCAISREDMALICANAIGVDTKQYTEADFTDKEEISDYARAAVFAMNALGLMQGDNDYFRPKANATRAQAAVLINNVREYLNMQKGR